MFWFFLYSNAQNNIISCSNLTTIFSGQSVFLLNNIDCNSVSISPLNMNNIFFDGKGFNISNLFINTTTQGTGLFGICTNLTIFNVNFVNSFVKSTMGRVGTVVGECSSCNLTNISIISTNSSSRSYIQGLNNNFLIYFFLFIF